VSSDHDANEPRSPAVTDLEPQPLTHNHDAFLARARERPGFQAAYDALGDEYQAADALIAARRAPRDA
jgi:hypothetical protein